MVEKKIYFIAEGIVDGEPIQSDKFNQIVNPETRETLFEDVFQITECAGFERYKHKEEFVSCILEIAKEYFEIFGEEISVITLTAIDTKTDVFQWGVSISNIEDEKFEYGTINWKADGKVLKIMKNLVDLKFKDFGLDAELNFLESPLCECGCGSRLDIILKSNEDIRDFIVGMISENECNQCAVFVLKKDDTMLFGFSQENDDEIQTYEAKFDFEDDVLNYDISELINTIHAHMYGILIEKEPGLFKILMD